MVDTALGSGELQRWSVGFGILRCGGTNYGAIIVAVGVMDGLFFLFESSVLSLGCGLLSLRRGCMHVCTQGRLSLLLARACLLVQLCGAGRLWTLDFISRSRFVHVITLILILTSIFILFFLFFLFFFCRSHFSACEGEWKKGREE
jgi:hypothetical protein